jgi:hypothetical protein
MSSGPGFDDGSQASLGSAAEEAARLVDAVRDWIDARAVSKPPPNESSECQLCPICQVLGMVRQGQPEVFEHLSHAADSLLAAVRAGITNHESTWARATRPDVEHIDIS